jgi:hypothetical protein
VWHFKYGGVSNTLFLSEMLNISDNEIRKFVKILFNIMPVLLLFSFFGQVSYAIDIV